MCWHPFFIALCLVIKSKCILLFYSKKYFCFIPTFAKKMFIKKEMKNIFKTTATKKQKTEFIITPVQFLTCWTVHLLY